jgi:DNA-binding PadR family transcriptional regulator
VVDTPTEIPVELKSYLDNDIGYRVRVNPVNFERPDDQELYSGLIRIHILYHACEGPIFGLGMIEELRRHGYKLSPGTLYPLLHGLERRGYLRSSKVRSGRWVRRMYRATSSGRRALALAREKVDELLGELLEHELALRRGVRRSS